MDIAILNENFIAELARREIVTETFRRLPPDKKEQVYRTVIRLFGEYGYDGLAVDRICREGGISKGSFFQYFLSKSHLLEFVLLLFDEHLEVVVREIRLRETSVLVRDRLRYLFREAAIGIRLDRDERLFYLFATRSLAHAGVVIEGIDLERHLRAYVYEIVERGVVTGEIRGDAPAELTGYLVSVLIRALAERVYYGKASRIRHDEEYLISFIFDGIKG